MCFFFQQDLFFTERIWKVHCLKPVFTYFDHHFVETSLSNRNSVILAAFFAQKASVWSNFMCSKPWCVARRDPRRRGGGNVGSTRWVRMVSDDISNPKAFLSRWYSFFKGIMLVFWRVYGIRDTLRFLGIVAQGQIQECIVWMFGLVKSWPPVTRATAIKSAKLSIFRCFYFTHCGYLHQLELRPPAACWKP